LYGLFAQLENVRLKVKYFHAKLSISRSLSTPPLPEHFGVVVVVVDFLKSYLELLGQWSTTLILPKLETRTIILGQGE